MGNQTSARSTNFSVPGRESHPQKRHTHESHGRHHSKHIGSKLPPLHVIKDSSTQTYESGSKMKTALVSVGTIFILISFLYFSLCYVIICSEYVQSLIVYSHYVKEYQPLQDLHKIGLPEARNIDVVTEDGILLHGWHLMNPGSELIDANKLEDTERNLRFEETLAFADRVVIYFHGNSETRGQGFRLRKIKQLAVYLQAHVIAFDYRGFADSEGYPSEHGTHLDARAVVHYIDNIVRRHNPQATGYLSQSFDQDSEAIEENLLDAAGEANMFSKLLGLLQLQQRDNATMVQQDGVSVVDASMDVAASDGALHSKPATTAQVSKSTQPHLFVYGHSLGAAVSTALAVEVSNLRPGALSGLILDSPFTSLPEAIKTHPLTNPFRTFPYIFQAMVANLQFKYANIDRIEKINAPILMIHGDSDIKINKSHSQLLFLRATNRTELPPSDSPLDYFGSNNKTVLVRSASGSRISVDRAYPIEWHVVRKAGHNEVYATREWIALVPDFVRRSELFAEL